MINTIRVFVLAALLFAMTNADAFVYNKKTKKFTPKKIEKTR